MCFFCDMLEKRVRDGHDVDWTPTAHMRRRYSDLPGDLPLQQLWVRGRWGGPGAYQWEREWRDV